MATIDVSGFGTLLPLFGFLLIFIVVYATLNKTKIIGESKFVQLLAAFIVSIMFILAVQPREYILSIIPLFAMLIIVMFLILAFTGFIGGLESWGKGIGKGMVVVMLIIFLVIAYFVFASTISPFISEIGKYPKVIGAIVLLVISALVSWVLVKSK
ncbi:MAG: hypothetical protein Q8L29_04260 [archaeon]|nr:hypothetical protein [archaeon]